MKTLIKQLTKLGEQEQRLVDLAADGEMPKDLIQRRLKEIRIKRIAAQQGLEVTSGALARGSA